MRLFKPLLDDNFHQALQFMPVLVALNHRRVSENHDSGFCFVFLFWMWVVCYFALANLSQRKSFDILCQQKTSNYLPSGNDAVTQLDNLRQICWDHQISFLLTHNRHFLTELQAEFHLEGVFYADPTVPVAMITFWPVAQHFATGRHWHCQLISKFL